MSDVPAGSAGWPGRAAVAIVRSDPPQVFLASNAEVLSRLVALTLVARLNPSDLAPQVLEPIRAALLEERWADAVVLWMEATGEILDAYPDEEIWTEERLDADTASFEMRLSRIFEDPAR